jgi:predicted NAD/FAD-binding protein
MKIAIVGAGISGLGCAHALSKIPEIDLTIYEGGTHIGGHSNTVDLTIDTATGPLTHGIDTGFLVFNERTYPRLIRLFDELDVPVSKSDMSFSASIPQMGKKNIEWAGTSLDSLFAQRKNLLKPSFLKMVADVVRFNKLCTRAALENKTDELELSVGEFIYKYQFSDAFRDWYFLPMVGAIWSCSVAQMLSFPISTMIRFCHNHGLIQITDRPQWLTVNGGSREYVNRIVKSISVNGGQFIRESVTSVSRVNGKVQISSNSSNRNFDHVIFATHSDQALKLISDIHEQEFGILSSVKYQSNKVILHTDQQLLPENKKCWAAWNYTCSLADGLNAQQVCVNYLINKLQPLPAALNEHAIIVSLNPVMEPAKNTIHAEIEYAHPIFDQAAVEAQANLSLIQGQRNTWFCGAWTGYGFHEDGLRSGELVAEAISEIIHRPVHNNLKPYELS